VGSTPNSPPPASKPIRSIVERFAVAGGLFGLGRELSASHPVPAASLMAVSVLYLIYELLTSPIFVANVPGMLRFVAAVLAITALAGIFLPRSQHKGEVKSESGATKKLTPPPQQTPARTITTRPQRKVTDLSSTLADRAETKCHEILEWAATMEKLKPNSLYAYSAKPGEPMHQDGSRIPDSIETMERINDQNFHDEAEKQWGEKFYGGVQELNREFSAGGFSLNIQTVSIGGSPWIATEIGEQLCGLAAEARRQAPHTDAAAHNQIVNHAIIARLHQFELDGQAFRNRCSMDSQSPPSAGEIDNWANRIDRYVHTSGIHDGLRQDFENGKSFIEEDIRYANVSASCSTTLGKIENKVIKLQNLEARLGR
jgi:hypothetical protein